MQLYLCRCFVSLFMENKDQFSTAPKTALLNLVSHTPILCQPVNSEMAAHNQFAITSVRGVTVVFNSSMSVSVSALYFTSIFRNS